MVALGEDDGYSGRDLNIFLTLTISGSDPGHIKAWTFYARSVGVFYAGMWYRQGGDLMMRGYNRVEVTSTGEQVSTNINKCNELYIMNHIV